MLIAGIDEAGRGALAGPVIARLHNISHSGLKETPLVLVQSLMRLLSYFQALAPIISMVPQLPLATHNNFLTGLWIRDCHVVPSRLVSSRICGIAMTIKTF